MLPFTNQFHTVSNGLISYRVGKRQPTSTEPGQLGCSVKPPRVIFRRVVRTSGFHGTKTPQPYHNCATEHRTGEGNHEPRKMPQCFSSQVSEVRLTRTSRQQNGPFKDALDSSIFMPDVTRLRIDTAPIIDSRRQSCDFSH